MIDFTQHADVIFALAIVGAMIWEIGSGRLIEHQHVRKLKAQKSEHNTRRARDKARIDKKVKNAMKKTSNPTPKQSPKK